MSLLVPDMLSFDTNAGARRRCGMAGKHRDTEDKVHGPRFHCKPARAIKLRAARKSTDPVCVGERPSQENVAPNMQMAPVLSRPIDDSSGAKRVRKAKRVPRRPASETAPRPEVADASRAALAPASPRAGKQRKLSDGSAALLQHCSGVQAANAADRQVSPPIDTVQERFVAYALHAKASAARGSSYLASCAIQADGSRSGEVDYLAHTVAVTRLGQGGYC